VRKTNAPEYFNNRFTIDSEKKNPKLVFRSIAFHFMDDQKRQETKIKYSSFIKEKFDASEVIVEDIQKKSEETQRTLHEKFNT